MFEYEMNDMSTRIFLITSQIDHKVPPKNICILCIRYKKTKHHFLLCKNNVCLNIKRIYFIHPNKFHSTVNPHMVIACRTR